MQLVQGRYRGRQEAQLYPASLSEYEKVISTF
jgi:hypothetical protein